MSKKKEESNPSNSIMPKGKEEESNSSVEVRPSPSPRPNNSSSNVQSSTYGPIIPGRSVDLKGLLKPESKSVDAMFDEYTSSVARAPNTGQFSSIPPTSESVAPSTQTLEETRPPDVSPAVTVEPSPGQHGQAGGESRVERALHKLEAELSKPTLHSGRRQTLEGLQRELKEWFPIKGKQKISFINLLEVLNPQWDTQATKQLKKCKEIVNLFLYQKLVHVRAMFMM